MEHSFEINKEADTLMAGKMSHVSKTSVCMLGHGLLSKSKKLYFVYFLQKYFVTHGYLFL